MRLAVCPPEATTFQTGWFGLVAREALHAKDRPAGAAPLDRLGAVARPLTRVPVTDSPTRALVSPGPTAVCSPQSPGRLGSANG